MALEFGCGHVQRRRWRKGRGGGKGELRNAFFFWSLIQSEVLIISGVGSRLLKGGSGGIRDSDKNGAGILSSGMKENI